MPSSKKEQEVLSKINAAIALDATPFGDLSDKTSQYCNDSPLTYITSNNVEVGLTRSELRFLVQHSDFLALEKSNFNALSLIICNNIIEELHFTRAEILEIIKRSDILTENCYGINSLMYLFIYKNNVSLTNSDLIEILDGLSDIALKKVNELFNKTHWSDNIKHDFDVGKNLFTALYEKRLLEHEIWCCDSKKETTRV